MPLTRKEAQASDLAEKPRFVIPSQARNLSFFDFQSKRDSSLARNDKINYFFRSPSNLSYYCFFLLFFAAAFSVFLSSTARHKYQLAIER